MSTLLLRLAAPLQAWGINSKFDRRNTERAPSKSGVIGLCAAALGYHRDEDDNLKKLSYLHFGVRIDKPGQWLKDFHMAHEESFWSSSDRSRIKRGEKSNSYLTMRYYLSDAAFLAGLEGDEDILREIDVAIRTPVYPLFLGRRSCPPEGRISLGIVPEDLRAALEKEPLISESRQTHSKTQYKPRIIMDATKAMQKNSYLLRDVPHSFDPKHRKYDFRSVYEFDTPLPSHPDEPHDALGAIEEVP